MKILVDSLPYYNDDCPFEHICGVEYEYCPKHWSKYYVCSEKNPKECELLKEKDNG